MEDERHLDGNAAAGILADVFAFDLTTATGVCAGCGSANEVGAFHAYCLEMGAILRCPGCGTAVIRMSRLGHGVWVDLGGLTVLRIAGPA